MGFRLFCVVNLSHKDAVPTNRSLRNLCFNWTKSWIFAARSEPTNCVDVDSWGLVARVSRDNSKVKFGEVVVVHADGPSFVSSNNVWDQWTYKHRINIVSQAAEKGSLKEPTRKKWSNRRNSSGSSSSTNVRTPLNASLHCCRNSVLESLDEGYFART